MADAERLQSLLTQVFELVGIDRRPDWLGPYLTSNRLERTLAHLAASDGTHSRLLACDASGRLSTVLYDANGYAVLTNAINGALQVCLRDRNGNNIYGTDEGGLIVAPLIGSREPSARGTIAESTQAYADLGSAADRLVLLRNPYTNTADLVEAWDSDGAGDHDRKIGYASPYGDTIAFMTGRYLEIESGTGTVSVHYQVWEL